MFINMLRYIMYYVQKQYLYVYKERYAVPCPLCLVPQRHRAWEYKPMSAFYYIFDHKTILKHVK